MLEAPKLAPLRMIIFVAAMAVGGCNQNPAPTHACKNIASGRKVMATWWDNRIYRYVDHNGIVRSIGKSNSDSWTCKPLKNEATDA